MAMDLGKAVTLFDELRRKISEERNYLSANEFRTRIVLVDPVLRMLGWDVEDTSVVKLEFEAGGGRADYGLMDSDGVHAVAVLESKRLGSAIGDNEVMQALNYANSQGIGYMIVCNGDLWRMYDVFQPAQLSERLMMELKIGTLPSYVNALRALALWRPNLGSGSVPTAAITPILVKAEIQDPPLTKIEPKTLVKGNTLTGEEPEGDWRDIARQGLHVKDTKPTALKIQGDVIDPCPEDWNSVLVQVANWLIDKKQFVPSTGYRKKPTNKRYLIHTEPIHDDGMEFRNQKELDNNMYIETHGGAPTCVSHCLYLLKKYGQGVNVQVKFK